MASACVPYANVSARWCPIRSANAAPSGATMAEGISWMTATAPLAATPPRSNAKTSIATQVAHSAQLNATYAAAIRRSAGSRRIITPGSLAPGSLAPGLAVFLLGGEHGHRAHHRLPAAARTARGGIAFEQRHPRARGGAPLDPRRAGLRRISAGRGVQQPVQGGARPRRADHAPGRGGVRDHRDGPPHDAGPLPPRSGVGMDLARVREPRDEDPRDRHAAVGRGRGAGLLSRRARHHPGSRHRPRCRARDRGDHRAALVPAATPLAAPRSPPPLTALLALHLVALLPEGRAGLLRQVGDRPLALRGRRRLLDVLARSGLLGRAGHLAPPTRYGADGGPVTRPFRFSVQANLPPAGLDWPAFARRVEAQGYGGLVIADHVVGNGLSPFPALAAAAAATTTLRLGTLVLDNDFRNPLLLAREAATVDVISSGRLELGIGAGWHDRDNHSLGISYDPPRVRVERLAEPCPSSS